MNIFNRILDREYQGDRLLGFPAGSKAAVARRINIMHVMTGGNGFRLPKKGPKLSKGGTTRKEREARLKALYAKNTAAEARFRESKQGLPGWGHARLRDAIERGDHLKSE